VTKTRGADRHIVIVFRSNGVEDRRFDITPGEYAALALPGAGRPPGVTSAEARRWFAYGGVPDYDGNVKLAHGEIAELSQHFELGVARRSDGRILKVVIPKDDVTISRGGGLTLTPRTSWPAETEIVSIESGVLRRLD
jgi:hypothetical protein